MDYEQPNRIQHDAGDKLSSFPIGPDNGQLMNMHAARENPSQSEKGRLWKQKNETDGEIRCVNVLLRIKPH